MFTFIRVLCTITLGMVLGFALGYHQEKQRVKSCEKQDGKQAVTQTIYPDGSYQCVYVKTQKWMAKS